MSSGTPKILFLGLAELFLRGVEAEVEEIYLKNVKMRTLNKNGAIFFELRHCLTIINILTNTFVRDYENVSRSDKVFLTT